MKTKITKIAIGLVSCLILQSCHAIEAPTVKLTLEVVTPDGQPVEQAKAGFAGGPSTLKGKFPSQANGVTDREGKFSAVIGCLFGEISFGADKNGYYSTEAFNVSIIPKGKTWDDAQRAGRWEPWEQSLKLLLKPIKNPVAMYARRITGAIPELRKPCGYDLEKGDWVAPYGAGLRTDIELVADGSIQNDSNFNGTLTIRLPGDGNGIQIYDFQPADLRSEFKMPYEAPTNGYAPTWTWRSACITDKPGRPSTIIDESNPNRGFIFRVRTVLDSAGNVVQAKYGKIRGPVEFFPKIAPGKWIVELSYYYNPDGTRNLEWNPKRNLFTNLSPGEQVYDP